MVPFHWLYSRRDPSFEGAVAGNAHTDVYILHFMTAPQSTKHSTVQLHFARVDADNAHFHKWNGSLRSWRASEWCLEKHINVAYVWRALLNIFVAGDAILFQNGPFCTHRKGKHRAYPWNSNNYCINGVVLSLQNVCGCVAQYSRPLVQFLSSVGISKDIAHISSVIPSIY